MRLTIWTDPGAPRTVHCRRGEPPPPIEFPKHAESRGYPSGGRLIRGILLPLSPLWTRGRKDEVWASSHTLATMIEAFTRLRVDVGYEGQVFVGTISRRRGGKTRNFCTYPPERSAGKGFGRSGVQFCPVGNIFFNGRRFTTR